MVDLPSPPPKMECVSVEKAEQTVFETYATVGGDSAQIAAWFSEIGNRLSFEIQADANDNGFRFVRLKLKEDAPYRVIGGAISIAQSRGLDIAFKTAPPICEATDD